MTTVGHGETKVIAPGESFECHVGMHNRARKLTTGLVTFAPGAVLPYHLHAFTESVTLLSGAMKMDVEGRSYSLKNLDNAVIRAGQAHASRNSSTTQNAVLHVAMAVDIPSRTLVDKFFSKRSMPDDSTGIPGAERINRFAIAKRSAAGPNTEFIDCFNSDLRRGREGAGPFVRRLTLQS